MPKKRKSTKSDLSLGKVQEPSHYESDETSYVKSEKKVQKKKKREGNEILDEQIHKVHVDYGEDIKKEKSDKTDSKVVLYNIFPILEVLKIQKEHNDEGEKVYKKYHSDPKTLKKYARMMACKGKLKDHIMNDIKEEGNYSFTNNMTYINPALRLLQEWGFVDTFREQPKQSTKFNIEEANETVQKFSKRSGLNPIEKLKLERARNLLNKKNEDTHPLYVFLTEPGEKEIATIKKDGGGLMSNTLRVIMYRLNYPISSPADTEE
jgi:hypothetical protein